MCDHPQHPLKLISAPQVKKPCSTRSVSDCHLPLLCSAVKRLPFLELLQLKTRKLLSEQTHWSFEGKRELNRDFETFDVLDPPWTGFTPISVSSLFKPSSNADQTRFYGYRTFLFYQVVQQGLFLAVVYSEWLQKDTISSNERVRNSIWREAHPRDKIMSFLLISDIILASIWLLYRLFSSRRTALNGVEATRLYFGQHMSVEVC